MNKYMVSKDLLVESPNDAAITSAAIDVANIKRFTVSVEHDGGGGTFYLEAKSGAATLWAKLESSEKDLTTSGSPVADGWEVSTDLPFVRVVTTGAAIITGIYVTSKDL